MTRRTLTILALAATTGVPALAACATTQSQAPLPPAVTQQPYGAPVVAAPGGDIPGAPPVAAQAPRSGSVASNSAPEPSSPAYGGPLTRPGYVPGQPPADGVPVPLTGPGLSASDPAAPSAPSTPEAQATQDRADSGSSGKQIGTRAPGAALLADRAPKPAVATPPTGTTPPTV
ncbi:MAG: hypothetical protein QOG60_2410, partial [Frankiaceae bacterium]|nr:hypothetical protein [Frankiaceae bacterium]